MRGPSFLSEVLHVVLYGSLMTFLIYSSIRSGGDPSREIGIGVLAWVLGIHSSILLQILADKE